MYVIFVWHSGLLYTDRDQSCFSFKINPLDLHVVPFCKLCPLPEQRCPLTVETSGSVRRRPAGNPADFPWTSAPWRCRWAPRLYRRRTAGLACRAYTASWCWPPLRTHPWTSCLASVFWWQHPWFCSIFLRKFVNKGNSIFIHVWIIWLNTDDTIVHISV